MREIKSFGAAHSVGYPDEARGESFRALHVRRRDENHPYVYVLLGEVGRRGSPWGTLFLDVCGVVYHFHASLEHVLPHVIDGTLTAYGKRLLAQGVPSVLDNDVPWKWVQASAPVFRTNPAGVAKRVRALYENQAELPRYQACNYALDHGVPLDPSMHNCASFIAHLLGLDVPTSVARMPMQLFNVLGKESK